MKTSKNYPIEHFHEVKLTREDIKKIGVDNLSFMSLILFATNELFVLQKELIGHMRHGDQRYDEIKTLSFIHKATILRLISAKIVEYIKLVDDQMKVWHRRRMNEEMTVMQALSAEKEKIKRSKYFSFTIKMRNLMVNHFIVSEVPNNLPHLTERSDFSLQLHEEQGNSFYPIGEEVVFVGFVNRYLKDESISSREEEVSFISSWIDWVLSSTKWANDVSQEFCKFILLMKLSGKIARRKTLFLDPHLVADVDQIKSPLLLRRKKS